MGPLAMLASQDVLHLRPTRPRSQRGGDASSRPSPPSGHQKLSRRDLLLMGGAASVSNMLSTREAFAGEQRVALITGANSGIGYATAQILMEQGWTTILGCRSVEAAEAAADRLGRLQLPGTAKVLKGAALDLGDLAQVRAFAEEVNKAGLPVNALVNNAGIMAAPEGRTADGLESQFGVNHMGHFALTMGLLPLLRESKARVVNVSSLASLAGQLDLSDLLWERRNYERWSAYGASKLANVLFSQELARREGGSGLVANAAHPGFVATNLARFILPPDVAKGARDDPEAYERTAKFLGLRSPRQGAECQVWLAASAEGGAARSAPAGTIWTDPGARAERPADASLWAGGLRRDVRVCLTTSTPSSSETSAQQGEKLGQDLWALSEELLAVAAKGGKAGDVLRAASARGAAPALV